MSNNTVLLVLGTRVYKTAHLPVDKKKALGKMFQNSFFLFFKPYNLSCIPTVWKATIEDVRWIPLWYKMSTTYRYSKRERERNSWTDAKETLTYTRQRRHCSRVGQTLFPKNATFLCSFAFFSKTQHSQVLLRSL